jgi:glycosyltransferase involved in cell wall biosynthesis
LQNFGSLSKISSHSCTTLDIRLRKTNEVRANGNQGINKMENFLSICIPTFNRAPCLARAIDHIYDLKLGFSFEVIISDNCSDDETQKVIERNIDRENFRYFRQDSNTGVVSNFIAACRMARGTYCIYLADDDLLSPEGLEIALNYMEKNKHVSCCQAPWELWDDKNKTVVQKFYEVEKETIFNKGQFLEFFNFIVNNDVYPEIAIYRTDNIKWSMFKTHKSFFPYVFMGRLLKRGVVAFLPMPFYRRVASAEVMDAREDEGVRITLNEWDLYRGGLEYLLGLAIPSGQGQADMYQVGQKMINQYMRGRMLTAVRLFMQTKRFMEAIETIIRIRGMGLSDETLEKQYRDMRPVASLQAVISTAVETPAVQNIIFCDVADPASIELIAKGLKQENMVSVKTFQAMQDVNEKENQFVIIGHDVNMETLVEYGFSREQMMTEHDIMSIY